MRKLNRKGFFKTLEVVIAIVLTFLFISYFIPYFTTTESAKKPELNVLGRLSLNEGFRSCAIGEDSSCIEISGKRFISLFVL